MNSHDVPGSNTQIESSHGDYSTKCDMQYGSIRPVLDSSDSPYSSFAPRRVGVIGDRRSSHSKSNIPSDSIFSDPSDIEVSSNNVRSTENTVLVEDFHPQSSPVFNPKIHDIGTIHELASTLCVVTEILAPSGTRERLGDQHFKDVAYKLVSEGRVGSGVEQKQVLESFFEYTTPGQIPPQTNSPSFLTSKSPMDSTDPVPATHHIPSPQITPSVLPGPSSPLGLCAPPGSSAQPNPSTPPESPTHPKTSSKPRPRSAHKDQRDGLMRAAILQNWYQKHGGLKPSNSDRPRKRDTTPSDAIQSSSGSLRNGKERIRSEEGNGIDSVISAAMASLSSKGATPCPKITSGKQSIAAAHPPADGSGPFASGQNWGRSTVPSDNPWNNPHAHYICASRPTSEVQRGDKPISHSDNPTTTDTQQLKVGTVNSEEEAKLAADAKTHKQKKGKSGRHPRTTNADVQPKGNGNWKGKAGASNNNSKKPNDNQHGTGAPNLGRKVKGSHGQDKFNNVNSDANNVNNPDETESSDNKKPSGPSISRRGRKLSLRGRQVSRVEPSMAESEVNAQSEEPENSNGGSDWKQVKSKRGKNKNSSSASFGTTDHLSAKGRQQRFSNSRGRGRGRGK